MGRELCTTCRSTMVSLVSLTPSSSSRITSSHHGQTSPLVPTWTFDNLIMLLKENSLITIWCGIKINRHAKMSRCTPHITKIMFVFYVDKIVFRWIVTQQIMCLCLWEIDVNWIEQYWWIQIISWILTEQPILCYSVL